MTIHDSFTLNELINEGDFIEVFISSSNAIEVCQVVKKFQDKVYQKRSRGLPRKPLGICDCLSLDCRGIEETVFWCPEQQRWYSDD